VVTPRRQRLRTHALFAGDVREAFGVLLKLVAKYTSNTRDASTSEWLRCSTNTTMSFGLAAKPATSSAESSRKAAVDNLCATLASISETHGLLIESMAMRRLTACGDGRAFYRAAANLPLPPLAHVSYAGKRDENGRVFRASASPWLQRWMRLPVNA